MPSLSGLDSAFLALETPRQPLHAAMAAVVDTSAMSEPYSFEAVRQSVRDEVGRRPLFRQRVVETPLGGLAAELAPALGELSARSG